MEEDDDMEQRKTAKKQLDMLHGGLFGKILLVALPLAASSILQQLFNSVDVAVVGKYASGKAQAAVGCNGSLINLMLNLFIGISVGANVVIANFIGQNKKEHISKTVHTSMTVAGISGIFLLVLGLLIAEPVLGLMDTPEDVMAQAVLYLRIYFLGMPFIMVYNFGAAILRSIGDTKRPLLCLFVSGLLNAGLNMLLVIVFRMDVAGVAIATVVSNVLSAGMVLYFLTHEDSVIRLSIRELRISGRELSRILRIGIPAGLQTAVFSLANVFIQTALNGHGADAVAGSAVTLNFEFYAYFVVTAFSQTAVTFISQNFGAGSYARCKKIFREIMLITILVIAVMSVAFVCGRDFFIGLFTSEPKVAEYASIRMIYLLSVYVLVPTYEVGGAALRGIGHSLTPAIITVFGTCVLRLVWVYTVCKVHTQFEVLLFIYPLSWVVTGTAMLITYFIIQKKVLCPAERRL
ncbi:MAG: MATE family efflux transporter [Bacteroides sp.]|nr:MATE family efflux transporter [Bacteroides sp.]MCM1549519.1 MATE family efflux transporter [Clostridium sp.]